MLAPPGRPASPSWMCTLTMSMGWVQQVAMQPDMEPVTKALEASQISSAAGMPAPPGRPASPCWMCPLTMSMGWMQHAVKQPNMKPHTHTSAQQFGRRRVMRLLPLRPPGRRFRIQRENGPRPARRRRRRTSRRRPLLAGEDEDEHQDEDRTWPAEEHTSRPRRRQDRDGPRLPQRSAGRTRPHCVGQRPPPSPPQG